MWSGRRSAISQCKSERGISSCSDSRKYYHLSLCHWKPRRLITEANIHRLISPSLKSVYVKLRENEEHCSKSHMVQFQIWQISARFYPVFRVSDRSYRLSPTR